MPLSYGQLKSVKITNANNNWDIKNTDCSFKLGTLSANDSRSLEMETVFLWSLWVSGKALPISTMSSAWLLAQSSPVKTIKIYNHPSQLLARTINLRQRTAA